MFVCYDSFYKGMKNFFFVKEINLKKKLHLPQFNVFSIKGLVATLVLSLNY